MIYGKISLKNWSVACVEGEEPESFFEGCGLRLFFYGTLYNRDKLRESPDDSNAKLAASAYLADPAHGFARLDGSFTIVYYSKNECGVVRDHHGTHYPVYCNKTGDFSTSWQFLAERSEEPVSYDAFALSSFLRRGILQKGRSVMCDIFTLDGGQQFHVSAEGWHKEIRSGLSGRFSKDLHGLERSRVFEYDSKVRTGKHPDVESCSRRYGELHVRAIQRRIGDSRRVGILLSGGYDSGANLAALRSIYDGGIDSYSVGFKGDAWSELPVARLMSETFGTRHHEYEIDGSEINFLPDIVRFLKEPFVEGGLMVNYCAMRMIGSDKPDVILGGDGSDQYFGTSGREVALHYLAARMGLRPLLHGLHALLSCKTFDTGGKLSRLNFQMDKVLHILEGERFGFSSSELRGFLQDEEYGKNPFKPLRADIRSFEHLYIQHALASDLEIVINRIILYKASRMAQMFGNNLVFPFMDLDLYEYLQQLPVSMKCKGDSVWDIACGRCESKYLLKHCYKPLLPEAVTARKKQGGFAPMPLFFRDRVQRDRLKDFILSSDIYVEYLNRKGGEKFLTDYDREASGQGGWFWARQNKALQYFNLLTLVTWWEEFMGGRKVSF